MLTAEILQSSTASPLYTRMDPGLIRERVSSRSCWGDDCWIFDNPLPGAQYNEAAIVWNFGLPDGRRLTDPVHHDLLDWLRRFIWSLFTVGGNRRKPLGPGSAGQLNTGLRVFVIWMVKNNFRMPSELGSSALAAYWNDMAEALADDNESGVSTTQAISRLRIPILLWQQRKILATAGIASMPATPWDGRTIKSLAADLATKSLGWIKPLPDEVAIPILNKAAWFLGPPADDVIRLHQKCVSARDRSPGRHKNGPGTQRTARYQRQRLVAESFEFSWLPGETSPWHGSLHDIRTSRCGRKPVVGCLRSLIHAVREAAVITIQAGTGMRISEICGLPAGMDPLTGLPSCVRIDLSSTGLNEIFIVRTVLTKTEETPREVEWVIGMRPVGSTDTPLPVRALIVLNVLFAHYRTLSGINRLLITFPHGGLSMSGTTIAVMKSMNLRRNIKHFVGNWVSLSHLPDQSAHPVDDNDLVQYRETRGRCIKTHQLRKLYANFALSVDPTLLPALQMHFHHLSQAMTEEGYWGRNPLQIEPLSTVQRQQTNLLMFEMATGRSLVAGRMGEQLEQHIAELSARLRGQSITEGWKTTQRFVNEYDLRLWFAPHGNCLPMVPESMRCHALAGTTSWLNRAPNFATREPSVCAGCACFVIDGRHTGFWIDRYTRNQLAYKQAERLGQAHRFRVIR
ncbi:hypothetical protein [Azospirillum himalayense]|uniref:Tyr recombinase domain-containing protein n=1 Tax=Azospirillum himalayense TaxID=654847 RepID=A0ABW0G1B6_9PROT